MRILSAQHPNPKDVTLVIRAEDGRVLDASRDAEALYGYSRAELLVRTVFDLRPEGFNRVTAAQLAVAEVRPVRFETVHRHRSGRTFGVEVSARGMMQGRHWVLLAEVRPLPDEPLAPATYDLDQGHLPRVTVWTPSLALGIENLDIQHRHICSAIDHLRDGMKSHYLGGVPGVIASIQRYVDVHFTAEEGVMERRGYPGLKEHRAAHVAFTGHFANHQAALAHSMGASAVLDLSSWLTHWIREHIRRVDTDLGRFLRAPPSQDLDR